MGGVWAPRFHIDFKLILQRLHINFTSNFTAISHSISHSISHQFHNLTARSAAIFFNCASGTGHRPHTGHRAPVTSISHPISHQINIQFHINLTSDSQPYRAERGEIFHLRTGHRTPAAHRAPGTGHRPHSGRATAPGTRHRAPGTGHWAPGTGHRAPGTGHRTPGTEHRAPGTTGGNRWDSVKQIGFGR